KVALQRGPIIYCAEWIDNDGKASNIIVPGNAVLTTEYKPDLLNGVMVIKSDVPAIVVNKEGNMVSTVNRKLTAIPYYAWAHRGKGEMMVWFPTKVADVDLIANE
ncbi:MAG TPA: glycoside hydrolase family 127 protein, partial [Chitinophagaceae bacterium]|nr:glycoside hydrolase family 127 protein [Chitinophagaceae bacterium]